MLSAAEHWVFIPQLKVLGLYIVLFCYQYFYIYLFLHFRDINSKTCYQLSANKITRDEFRKFMAEFPDRYDYKTAKVIIFTMLLLDDNNNDMHTMIDIDNIYNVISRFQVH